MPTRFQQLAAGGVRRQRRDRHVRPRRAACTQTPGKGLNEVRMAYVLEAEKIERAMDILKKAIEVYNAK